MWGKRCAERSAGKVIGFIVRGMRTTRAGFWAFCIWMVIHGGVLGGALCVVNYLTQRGILTSFPADVLTALCGIRGDSLSWQSPSHRILEKAKTCIQITEACLSRVARLGKRSGDSGPIVCKS